MLYLKVLRAMIVLNVPVDVVAHGLNFAHMAVVKSSGCVCLWVISHSQDHAALFNILSDYSSITHINNVSDASLCTVYNH